MRRRFLMSTVLLAAAIYIRVLHADGAGDDARNDHVRYRGPAGFQGNLWGKPLSAFAHFERDPLYVQTASSRGKTTFVDMKCVARAMTGCDLEASLQTLQQKVEGEGFHALAEYYVDAQGLQFGEPEAVLFPLFYQFCARWGGVSSRVPQDVQEKMKFCGMRMLFRSETLKELRAHDDGHVTNYDRILRQLIGTHGEPEGYVKHGRVIIHAPGEKIEQARERRFDEWRWCSLRTDRDIAPGCQSSIVFAFDATTGWGVVLYATRPIWEFAYARHQGGAEDDALYKLLHGLGESHPVDESCTGSNLCRPGAPRAMSHDVRTLFRLPR